MNLHDYLRIVRNGLWLIALMAVAGAAGGAALAFLTTPNYQVGATVYVTAAGTGTTGDLQQGNVFAMQKAPTYAELGRTETVLQRAAEILGEGTTAAQLQGATRTSVRAGTSLIDVFASGSNPENVAAWANGVAEALVAEATRLDGSGDPGAPIGEGTTAVILEVVDAAEVPTVAVSPQPRYNLLVGTALGLALGLGVIVVRHALDTRINTVRDLPRSVEFATRTSIPSRKARGFRPTRGDIRLEAFRTLRTNLQFGARTGGSIAVAAVDSASDALAVAEQLGAVIAETGSQVVVVNADLRPPASDRRFKGGPLREVAAFGVADILSGSASVADATAATGIDNLFSIPPGAVAPSSAQLLSTRPMREMLEQLKRDYSFVILACPPLVERSESAVVAALADSTLVVVQAGATKRGPLLFALELLEGVRAPSISVVLDNVRDLDLTTRDAASDASSV